MGCEQGKLGYQESSSAGGSHQMGHHRNEKEPKSRLPKWMKKRTSVSSSMNSAEIQFRSAILIQKWYRRYKANLEKRKMYTWNIFQSLEYAGEQDQIKLYNFFSDLLTLTGQGGTEGEGRAKRKEDGGIARIKTCGLRKSSSSVDLEDRELFNYVELSSIQIEDSYNGPMLSFPLTIEQITNMMQAFRCKEQLHPRFVLELLFQMRRVMKAQNNVHQISTSLSKQITIIGDLHGQLDDLMMIFYKNGIPASDNPYVVNGDFVDRGDKGVEVALTLFAFATLQPPVLYLNRGNHEDYIVNLRYGFVKEVMNKYKNNASKIIKMFTDVFSWLPLAAVIDGKVLVCHGGISDRFNMGFINRIDRHKFISVLRPPGNTWEVSDADAECSYETRAWKQVLDLLWSDPSPLPGCTENSFRGGGAYFGPDITKKILERHNLSLLVRSHECKPEGFEWAHNNTVLTIFSASNYYSRGSNKGAYCKMGPELKPQMFQYNTSRRNTGNLNLRQRVSLVEEAAIRELTRKFNEYKDELLHRFMLYDPNKTGRINAGQWNDCVSTVLHVELPWRTLRSKLVKADSQDGEQVIYESSFKQFSFESTFQNGKNLTTTLYRNKDKLETIFRMMDKDNSGCISMDEFLDSCHLLSKHLGRPLDDKTLREIAQTIDFNKDNYIDFNEFLEAFRLVNIDDDDEFTSPDIRQIVE